MMNSSVVIFSRNRIIYQNHRICSVPFGVGSKTDLLLSLSKELSFPEYFRPNWDSLVDVLRDDEWLKFSVVICHKDIPKIGRLDLETYLDILIKSQKKFHALYHEIVAIFPPEAENHIRPLMARD